MTEEALGPPLTRLKIIVITQGLVLVVGKRRPVGREMTFIDISVPESLRKGCPHLFILSPVIIELR